MRVQLPKTSVSVFRIKTRSRKVTEAQPAVGRSVRRKRKFAVMGQSFGEVLYFFRQSQGEVRPNEAGEVHPNIILLRIQRKRFGYNVCSL